MEHNIKVGIDATPASRGAAEFVGAINKITTATKAYQSALTSLSRNSGKTNFAKMAEDMRSLGNLRVSGSQTDNLNNLSNALKGFKGPSAAAVKNTREFMQVLGSSSISTSSMRAVEQFSTAMNGFKGPSRSSAAAVQSLLTALSRANINPATGSAIASVTAALSNFKGPSKTSAANVSQLMTALAGARISPTTATAVASVGAAFANFRGPTAASAKNLSAFLDVLTRAGTIPNLSGIIAQLNQLNLTATNVGRGLGNLNSHLGRAGSSMRNTGQSAVTLTGNMRGLENAMSISYQLGSQLRVLFGSLTFAEFTKGVYNATLAQQRFNTTLGVTAKSQAEAAQSMEFATNTADKYGISLTSVYDEYGKFSTAAKLAGQSTQNVQYIFESMSGAMRVMGTDVMGQQRVFRALTQMFSKGAVMAEELRTQLGEQLPGAFELMQKALSDFAGKPVDLNKLLQEGKVDDSAVLLMAQKITEVFGPQVEAALQRADAQIGRLSNTWTKFQITVGNNGVQDAIGDVAKRLNEVMSSDAFQENAIKLAKGLGDAIRLMGDAAIWAVNNAKGLATVIVSVLAYSGASTTIGLLTNLATAATRARGAMGLVALTFGAVPAAIGAATLALGLYGDEQIKVGEETFTLNQLAVQLMHDIGGVAKSIWAEFVSLGDKAQEVWDIINGLTFEGIISAGGSMVTSLLTGFGFISDASAQAAATNANEWGKSFALAMASGQAFFTKVATDAAKIGSWVKNSVKFGASMTFGSGTREENQADFVKNAKSDFDAIQAIADETYRNIIKDWNLSAEDITGGFKGTISADLAEYSKHAKEQAELRNQAAREAARIRAAEEEERRKKEAGKGKTLPNLDGVNPFRGGGLDVSDKTSVGKRLKEEAKAVANYTAEIKALTTALAAGKITLEQFNAGMEIQSQKLQESKDPYAAMVRSMEDELKVSGMASKAREVEIEHRTKINELAEKGVYVTAEMSAKIKDLIAQQQKMNNQPLRQWVDGIEDFGTATDRVAVKALDNMADSISELVVTGKADFASLAQSILKDFIRAGINKLYKDMFSNMFGGTKEIQREQLTKPMAYVQEAQATNLKTQADTWELKGGLGQNGAGPVKNGAFQSEADIARDAALNGLTTGTEKLRGSFDLLGNSMGTFETSATKAGPQLDTMTTGSINATNALNNLAQAATSASDAQRATAMGQPMPGAPGSAGVPATTAGPTLAKAAAFNGTSKQLTLNNQEIVDLKKTLMTEVDAGLKGSAYDAQAAGVVDTILNRKVSGKWGGSITDVVNAKSQFSDVNGPVAWKNGRTGVSGIPDTRLLSGSGARSSQFVDKYLAERMAGKGSSVGGNLHYANPAFSDAKNQGWISKLQGPTLGEGNRTHKHGTTAGYSPVDPNYSIRTQGSQQPVPVAIDKIGSTGVANGNVFSKLSYANMGATRNMKVDAGLENKLREAVGNVYGKDYTAEIYSGGQPAKGLAGIGKRTGSTRHDDGNAADIYVRDPMGNKVTGDGLAPLGQYWQARQYGGTGMEMRGGGVHLDQHTDRARSWDYRNQGGQYTGAQAAGIAAGQKGIMPTLNGQQGIDPQTTASIKEATTSLQQLGTEAQNVAQKTQQAAQQQQSTTQQSTMANQQKTIGEQQSAMATQQAGSAAQSSAPQFTAAGQAIASAGQQAGQGAQAAQAGLGQLGGLLSSIPGVGQYMGMANQIMGMANQIMGIFGMGLFEEGGMSHKPVKTMSVPHYAEGTANTSGGMPAVLHPNEAVIPLSRGRKIPVDINSGSAQKSTTDFSRAEGGGSSKNEFHFHGIKDADGFKNSKRDVQATLAGTLERNARRQN